MKIKTIYSLNFLLAGFIVLSMLYFILLGLFPGLFDFFSQEPLWSAKLFLKIFSGLFFIAFIEGGLFMLGRKKGKRIEREGFPERVLENAKNLFLFFTILSIFFFLQIVFFYVNLNKRLAESDRIFDNLGERGKIEQLDMRQSGKRGIDVLVNVSGEPSDVYELVLKILPYKHIEKKLMELRDKVTLRDQKRKTIKFFIPFIEMEESYRQLLLQENPDFKESDKIEESFLFLAQLHLKQTADFSEKDLSHFFLPEESSRGVAQFRFQCRKERCQIIQEDKTGETSEK